jgi:hypothetical protein
LTLFAILCVNFYFFTQDLPLPKNIQSPNAASLGKYGDIPVSLYTGTLNIAIPLYSINKYNIPLNISLYYDGYGARIKRTPIWICQKLEFKRS